MLDIGQTNNRIQSQIFAVLLVTMKTLLVKAVYDQLSPTRSRINDLGRFTYY